MADDQESLLTPERLKKMAAGFKRRERAEKKRPSPENALLVARNVAAKAFWEENNRLIDDRVKKYPEDVELAVNRFREAVAKGDEPKRIDSLEKTLLELAERDKKLNTRWAQLKRKEDFDELERAIIDITDSFRKKRQAEVVWRELKKLAEKCEARADNRAGRIDLEYDGDSDLRDDGDGPISSGDPRRSFIQLILRGTQQEHDKVVRRVSRKTFDKMLSELKGRFQRPK